MIDEPKPQPSTSMNLGQSTAVVALFFLFVVGFAYQMHNPSKPLWHSLGISALVFLVVFGALRGASHKIASLVGLVFAAFPVYEMITKGMDSRLIVAVVSVVAGFTCTRVLLVNAAKSGKDVAVSAGANELNDKSTSQPDN